MSSAKLTIIGRTCVCGEKLFTVLCSCVSTSCL